MNKVELVGRLTKDPEIRTTTTGKFVATFTLAVNRRNKSENQPSADFIPIVLWGKTAEIAEKYLGKGHLCGIVGRIQIRSYEANDGTKRYVTEVVGEEMMLLQPKSNGQSQGQSQGEFGGHSVSDEQIPF